MSTNFLVTQAQRDLAVAEVAELRAVADYRKSVVNFERVQEAGGGSVLFTSSSRRREPRAHERRRRSAPTQSARAPSGRTSPRAFRRPVSGAPFYVLSSVPGLQTSRKPLRSKTLV